MRRILSRLVRISSILAVCLPLATLCEEPATELSRTWLQGPESFDPNLFHLDWDRTFEVLATIVVLSAFVERSLALIFESRMYVRWETRRRASRGVEAPIKELIAFAVAAGLCLRWSFDAVSIVVLRESTTRWGELLTAGVIAGGTKGSVKLFRDVLDFKSTAYREKERLKKSRSAVEPVSEKG